MWHCVDDLIVQAAQKLSAISLSYCLGLPFSYKRGWSMKEKLLKGFLSYMLSFNCKKYIQTICSQSLRYCHFYFFFCLFDSLTDWDNAEVCFYKVWFSLDVLHSYPLLEPTLIVCIYLFLWPNDILH